MVLLALWMFCCSAVTAGQAETWEEFERAVRDGKVSPADGKSRLEAWQERLAAGYPGKGFAGKVFFPLRGYALKDVGGRAGQGYDPNGYRFLDGNRHGGHPALDIFIHDADSDSLDDRTGRPAEVLAAADGVILSVHRQWAAGGDSREIRGGNYLWIYHPLPKTFSYYAHLKGISGRVGDVVHGGGAVGTLGRTGKNACLPRSPTHLHFMLLWAQEMKPMNPWEVLSSGTWPVPTE